MTDRRCLLCERAGLDNQGRMPPRSTICQHHHDALKATGRRWCSRCQRAVPAAAWRKPYCRPCGMEQPPPAGFVPLATVAARVFVDPVTALKWLKKGWQVEARQVGRQWYVRDLPRYPDAPRDPRAGRRRRPELDQCRACGARIDNPSHRRRSCPACRLANRRAGIARATAIKLQRRAA